MLTPKPDERLQQIMTALAIEAYGTPFDALDVERRAEIERCSQDIFRQTLIDEAQE